MNQLRRAIQNSREEGNVSKIHISDSLGLCSTRTHATFIILPNFKDFGYQRKKCRWNNYSKADDSYWTNQKKRKKIQNKFILYFKQNSFLLRMGRINQKFYCDTSVII